MKCIESVYLLFSGNQRAPFFLRDHEPGHPLLHQRAGDGDADPASIHTPGPGSMESTARKWAHLHWGQQSYHKPQARTRGLGLELKPSPLGRAGRRRLQVSLAQAIGTPRALANPSGNEAYPTLSREKCSLFCWILSQICFQQISNP